MHKKHEWATRHTVILWQTIMAFRLSSSWTDPAVRIAAAGVGFLVGGPLGASLAGCGALLAGAVGAAGEELARNCAENIGNKTVKKLFKTESGSDDSKEPSNSLEQVYREALHHGLEEIRSLLIPDFQDWFDNWSTCLASSGVLDLAPIHPDQLTAADLDPIFQRTMEQLDAQGSAISRKSMSLKQERRTIPDALLSKLSELLPERFQKWLHNLIHKQEYEQAWKEKQQQFHETTESLLASIKSDTSQILTGQNVQNEKLDELLRIVVASAEKDKRIDHAEARALSAEAAADEWKKKYLELAKSNPSLDALLSSGDFEAAAHAKTQQLEKQSSDLAKNYFELGTIHELRFDWPKALEAYREAWKLDHSWEYGSRYAESARVQNQFFEAIAVYEALREMSNNPGDTANTLNSLGNLYCQVQQIDDAEITYRKSISTYRELAPNDPDIAMPLHGLAIIYHLRKQVEEAEAAYRESIATVRKLAENNPHEYLPIVAKGLCNLAKLFYETHRMRESEEISREALQIERALAEDNPNIYLPNVALTLNVLGILYHQTQRIQEAVDAYREALIIQNKLVQDNRDAFLPALAGTLNNLANLYCEMQRLKQAEEMYEEVLSIICKLAEKNSDAYLPDIAKTLRSLGILYRDTDRKQKAEDTLRRSLSIYFKLAENNVEVYVEDVVLTIIMMARLCRDMQKKDEALAYCHEAEKILEPLWCLNPTVHGDLMAEVLMDQARLCKPHGEPDKHACGLARRAFEAAYSPMLKLTSEQLVKEICISADS